MDIDVIIVLLLLLGAMAAYVPVYISLFFTGLLGFVFFAPETQTLMLVQGFFKSMDNFALVVVLFFILCGNIMTAGSIVEKLIKVVNSLVSWLPGGLGMAGCLGCGLFGAISGSTVATVVALGGFMIPALIRNGYSEKYAVGLMTTSPNLGIIIPPSISMILYCMITNVSLQGLFLTGFVPGVLIMALVCVFSYWTYRDSTTVVRMPVPNLREVLAVFREGFWALMLPVIIFVGTFSGMFTANEAAVVACVYAFIVELLIHRTMKFRDVKKVVVNSAVTSATLLIIVAGATCFGRYLTFENVPAKIAETLRHPDHRPGADPAAADLQHRLHALRAADDGEPGDRLLHPARGGEHVHRRCHRQQEYPFCHPGRDALSDHSAGRAFRDDLLSGPGAVAAQGHGLLGGDRHELPGVVAGCRRAAALRPAANISSSDRSAPRSCGWSRDGFNRGG